MKSQACDAVSRLTSLTDPRGSQTQFQYDGLNRVTEIADARHGLTGFSYDPNGNLLTVADAKNQTTAYTYDTMDRLATRKDALNRQESYQYDPAGNLTQFIDRKNQQGTFQYDALNRRIGASFADGSSVTFVYDSVGRLSRAADSAVGAIDFVYDSLDRLIQEITSLCSITYAYDVLGRRITMTVSGQQPVSYGYDAASRLVQVQQGSLIVGPGYDAAGRRTSLIYPNGTSTSYSYNFSSRLTNILHQGPAGVIESLSYAYDSSGNRISLTRANGTASNLPAAVQAAYDATNEQIQFNSATPNLTYDANGNLSSQTDASGTTSYTWDARNRLIARSGPGINESYSYDALGRRISKTINGVTTQFLYDGHDIVQETSGAGTASYLRSLNIDEPFVRQMASGSEFYHTDALGSTLALSNAAGASTVSYSYEAFGRTTITGTSSNPFQYTGRENDGTGLSYYRARYLSSALHRFLIEDPFLHPTYRACLKAGLPFPWVGNVQTVAARNTQNLNLYAYTRNTPIKFRDPLGLVVPDGIYVECRAPKPNCELASANVTENKVGYCIPNAATGEMSCNYVIVSCEVTCNYACDSSKSSEAPTTFIRTYLKIGS